MFFDYKWVITQCQIFFIYRHHIFLFINTEIQQNTLLVRQNIFLIHYIILMTSHSQLSFQKPIFRKAKTFLFLILFYLQQTERYSHAMGVISRPISRCCGRHHWQKNNSNVASVYTSGTTTTARIAVFLLFFCRVLLCCLYFVER